MQCTYLVQSVDYECLQTFHFFLVSDTTNDRVSIDNPPEISFDIVLKRFALHLLNPRAPIDHIQDVANHADNAL